MDEGEEGGGEEESGNGAESAEEEAEDGTAEEDFLEDAGAEGGSEGGAEGGPGGVGTEAVDGVVVEGPAEGEEQASGESKAEKVVGEAAAGGAPGGDEGATDASRAYEGKEEENGADLGGAGEVAGEVGFMDFFKQTGWGGTVGRAEGGQQPLAAADEPGAQEGTANEDCDHVEGELEEVVADERTVGDLHSGDFTSFWGVASQSSDGG